MTARLEPVDKPLVGVSCSHEQLEPLGQHGDVFDEERAQLITTTRALV